MPLSDDVKALINNAWNDGYPCLLATAGARGPTVGPKGSLLVFDDQHLAYWERTKRGVLENLGADRRVCVLYANFVAQRDGKLDSGFLRFYGIAELHESGAIHDAIFAKLSQREQTHKGADTGVGVLIKIEAAVNHRGESII
ncbi:MAG TPA: pyridoxamine 5'-phosphate oxidase family protein [Beijerinckiaceae bacterium]|nr:pyridoxamine 5'-phosphate oxidase family protein [Beijerinckiaceae bacterium]